MASDSKPTFPKNRLTATTLQGGGGETKTAIVINLLHVTAEVARQRLSAHNGHLHETLAARVR
jgi:N-acetylmuramic acid 6-phosphate (MurNAc-6-P) etherase